MDRERSVILSRDREEMGIYRYTRKKFQTCTVMTPECKEDAVSAYMQEQAESMQGFLLKHAMFVLETKKPTYITQKIHTQHKNIHNSLRVTARICRFVPM